MASLHGRLERVGTTAILLATLVAGCAAPSATLAGADDASAPVPLAPAPWRPNPGEPSQFPSALAGDFVATDYGFARKDFPEPVTPTRVLLQVVGYEGAEDPTHYVRMRDGTLIGVAFEVDGRSTSLDIPTGYVFAQASLRGTGCSGGAFDLVDPTSTYDGHEVVEWIAWLPWTHDKVGLLGFSYGAITNVLVAATQPPSLGALAASVSFADPYRDVAFPGGVPNLVFSVGFSAVLRPYRDYQGTAAGIGAGDAICASNVATRPPADPQQNPYLAFASGTDGPWWQIRAPIAYAGQVKVPTLLTAAFQDDEQSPRGMVELFHALRPDPVLVDGHAISPKRLVFTNGFHGNAHKAMAEHMMPWFETWLNQTVAPEALQPVTLRLGSVSRADVYGLTSPLALDLDQFPASNTTWTRYYLAAGGRLVLDEATATGEPTTYVAASGESWLRARTVEGIAIPQVDTRGAAPDPFAATFTSEPMGQDTFVAGHVAVTLTASMTTIDTDFFVRVSDRAPDGTLTPITRGFLRASHRALDVERTTYAPDGAILRPYHPHTAPSTVDPEARLQYAIEVAPIGHVFQTGHSVVLDVSAPPAVDGLWGFAPQRYPGRVSIHHDADAPSSILLPIVPWDALPTIDLSCGKVEGYVCVGAAR